MPLNAPVLDDRKFDAIFAEARLRIPRYNPEWTDFNESDPGITLLQLFAWLTEMMLFRMNQVPDRNYIKFLQLLGMELRPAQPSVAHVTFTPKDGVPEAGPVPQGTQLSGEADNGDPLVFETETGLSLIAFPLSDVQVYDGSAFMVVTPANDTPSAAATFQPFGFEPSVGSALYLGFTPPKLTPPATPSFPQQMHFRVALPPAVLAGAPQNADDVRQPPAPPVTLEWEYRSKGDPTRWRRLNLFSDESAAFTREGYVLVQGPTDPVASREGKIPDERLWIRVRLASGNYSVDVRPEIDFIRPNVAPAINLSTVRDELLGLSDGTPNQTFTLLKKPIAPGSLSLVVKAPGLDGVPWEEQDDLLASGKFSPHFVLNEVTGQIRFGNGTRGEIPVAGAEIIATQYRFGGGDAGNVKAGAITAVMTQGVPGLDKVENERPAVGGRNEQNLEELKEQAPALLRSRERAVTVEDFTAIARRAGGVAKAIALPLTNPDHPSVDVAGAVTVVIVPDTKDTPPEPSSDLIRQVCNYLDDYRLITTELFVRGPKYLPITVEASVLASPHAAFDKVSHDVSDVINVYLDPLKGALDFGDELFPTNLLGRIQSVENVRAVRDFKVLVKNVPHDVSQPVIVPPGGLCYGTNHTITVGPLQDQ